MASFTVNNIKLSSIVSCVPKNRVDNLNDANIPEVQGKKIVDTTGIRYRRIAINKTTADLCQEAAEDIFSSTSALKEDIEALIFVTQTPDYVLPATAVILQNKLDLPQNCLAFDISLGCSGYVYGLSVIIALLEKSQNVNAKALLLVGDTSSKMCNVKDLSTYPLFGDAGTATLIEKSEGDSMSFDLNSDGKGAGAIIVEHGAFREPYSSESETEISTDGTNFRRKKDLYLNGMDVFSFGISKVPKAVKKFYEIHDIDDTSIDYFVFHQANMFMNEKIRKKLSLPEEKVPYSLFDFANVSSATIPLTITSQLVNKLDTTKQVISCGFGVGLSWGVSLFTLYKDTYLNTIETD